MTGFYAVTGGIFIVWMLFFDADNIIAQFGRVRQAHKLADEQNYYIEKIAEVEKERQEVFGSLPQLEKFAREKYLMKKPNEDIYVVVEEE